MTKSDSPTKDGLVLLSEAIARMPGVELQEPLSTADYIRLMVIVDNVLGTKALETYLQHMEPKGAPSPGDVEARFAIGDSLRKGNRDSLPDVSSGTLRRWRWVAYRVPPDIRNASLSFSCHEAVGNLPRREQRRWLAQAAKHGWSSKELRKRIKAGKSKGRKR